MINMFKHLSDEGVKSLGILYFLSVFLLVFGGLSLWSVPLLALCFFSLLAGKIKVAKRRSIFELAQTSHNRKILQEQGITIPSWIDFSSTDTLSCESVNTLVHQLWPHAKTAIEDTILSALTPILESLRPKFLSRLNFRQLDLGSAPPQISKLSTHKTKGGVSIDINFQVAGNSSIILDAGNGPIEVTAHLTDFTLDGILRVTFCGLDSNVVPGFKAISISLAQKPDISFKLKAVKIPLTRIPNLSDFIFELVEDILQKNLVFPKQLVFPFYRAPNDLTENERYILMDKSGSAVLRVSKFSAKIPSEDERVVVLSCTLNDGVKKTAYSEKQTKSANNANFIEWNSNFEWIVQDIHHSVLRCELLVGLQKIGFVQLELHKLKKDHITHFRFPLNGGRSGNIMFEVELKEFEDKHSEILLVDSPWNACFLYLELVECFPSQSLSASSLVYVECINDNKVVMTSGKTKCVFKSEHCFIPIRSASQNIEIKLREWDENLDREVASWSGHISLREAVFDGNGIGEVPEIKDITLVPSSIPCQGSPKVTVKMARKQVSASRREENNEQTRKDENPVITKESEFQWLQDKSCAWMLAMFFVSTVFTVLISVVFRRFACGINTFIVITIILGVGIKFANSSTREHVYNKETTTKIEETCNNNVKMEGIIFLTDTGISSTELVRELPPWLLQPDVMKVEFLNTALQYLWPTLSASVETMLLRIIKGYLPEFVEIAHLHLGSKPPLVAGLQHFPQASGGADAIIDFMLHSFNDAELQAFVFNIPITIKDIFAKGTLRLELGPLESTLPPFSVLYLSTPSAFNIDFTALIANWINVTIIPGVSALVKRVIATTLDSLMSPPKRLAIPLFTSKTNTRIANQGLGILRIHVRKAIDLPNVDIMSYSDPYCIVTISNNNNVNNNGIEGERKDIKTFITPVVENELNPVWDTKFEVLITRATSTIAFTVKDDEVIGEHVVLGKVSPVEILQKFPENVLMETTMPLVTPKDLSGKGQLFVDMEWKPFLPQEDVTATVNNFYHKPATEILEDWSIGVLFVKLEHCSDIAINPGNSLSVHFDIGGAPQSVSHRYEVGIMMFNSFFHFPFSDFSQTLHCNLYSEPGKHPVGSVNINIKDVVENGGVMEGVRKIQGSRSGTIRLRLQVMLLQQNRNDIQKIKIESENSQKTRIAVQNNKDEDGIGRSLSSIIINESGLNLVAAGIGTLYSKVSSPTKSENKPNASTVI
eukprot:m.162134 g.162134  ORF g.162134 m.162134 type:complete len:1228 (+) comp15196_c0_seq6:113-3796(+)